MVNEAMGELQKSRTISDTDNTTLNLTAIVVAKRHHVWFYPVSQHENSNCLHGTYVEHVVTSPYFQDFCMQSHKALQGTARPAHYFVLVDEMKKDLNFYGQLTHELCYTYVRATAGVSYASPAYYADRLCERGRHYLRDFYNCNHSKDAHDQSKDQKDYKAKLETTKSKERSKLFPCEKETKDTNTKVSKPKAPKPKKPPEEIIREVKDRDAVFQDLQQWTMKRATEEFYRYKEKAGNPWVELGRIAKTMFGCNGLSCSCGVYVAFCGYGVVGICLFLLFFCTLDRFPS